MFSLSTNFGVFCFKSHEDANAVVNFYFKASNIEPSSIPLIFFLEQKQTEKGIVYTLTVDNFSIQSPHPESILVAYSMIGEFYSLVKQPFTVIHLP
jgi:hypothetical protein